MDPAGTRHAVADHVIGVFSRERLSSALAATHRAGFGPYTRVLDGSRSSTPRQLDRLGLHAIDGIIPADDALVVLVNAPGRTAIVAEMFDQLGAEQTILAARGALSPPVQTSLDGLSPDLRAGGDDAASRT